MAHQDQFGNSTDKESTFTTTNQTSTPSTSPTADYERNSFLSGARFPTPGTTVQTPTSTDRMASFSPLLGSNYDVPPMKLPHMGQLSFPGCLMPPRPDCQSPLPRRKQARPRRRSGELCGAQDLSTGMVKPSSPAEETAENLCIKKTIKVNSNCLLI